MNSESSNNGRSPKQSFWTPMRIVAGCVVIGVVIAMWLSSCNSSNQTNQNSSTACRISAGVDIGLKP